ncbi:hypothetical protein [Streptomyces sp. NPDC098101]
MRTVLLAIVYYLVVTPIGLLARAVRDPLTRAVDPEAASYWAEPIPSAV